MTGTVFDIGYRGYTGAREGIGRSRRAVFKDGVRIALGLGRNHRNKILPWGFIALLTAIGLIMAITVGAINMMGGEGAAEQAGLPGHHDYYGIVAMIMFVFAAIVSPELLCRDRREGTINLYLVRPMTGTDYVACRWAAFLVVMLGAAWLPQLILFLGLAGGAPVPKAYVAAHWLDVPRFLLAGLVMAVYSTTLAMMTASFTSRRAYASVFMVGLFLITMPFTLAASQEIGGDGGAYVALFDLTSIPLYVGDIIFGQPSDLTEDSPARATFTGASLVAWYFAWILVPGAILWWRYRRLTP